MAVCLSLSACCQLLACNRQVRVVSEGQPFCHCKAPSSVGHDMGRLSDARGTRRYVYYHEGRRFLGKGPVLGLFSAGEWVRGKGHAMKTQWNAAMAAVDLMQVHTCIHMCPVKQDVWVCCSWLIQ